MLERKNEQIRNSVGQHENGRLYLVFLKLHGNPSKNFCDDCEIYITNESFARQSARL